VTEPDFARSSPTGSTCGVWTRIRLRFCHIPDRRGEACPPRSKDLTAAGVPRKRSEPLRRHRSVALLGVTLRASRNRSCDQFEYSRNPSHQAPRRHPGLAVNRARFPTRYQRARRRRGPRSTLELAENQVSRSPRHRVCELAHRLRSAGGGSVSATTPPNPRGPWRRARPGTRIATAVLACGGSSSRRSPQ
jgi:hypothetical protein